MIKTAQQIEDMRVACKHLAEILEKVESLIQPGQTSQDIENFIQSEFKQKGVKPNFLGYHGFPAYACININEETVHTIPHDRKVEEGDLVTVDLGVLHNDMNSDSALSVIAGRDINNLQPMIDTCKRAMFAGIKQIKPGNKVGDISAAIQKVVEDKGYSVIRELTGHGIGKDLHEEPIVANHGKKGQGLSIKPGMIICIEPIITNGDRYIETLSDNWTIVTKDGSIGCQTEHTVLATPTGFEILTLRNNETIL